MEIDIHTFSQPFDNELLNHCQVLVTEADEEMVHAPKYLSRVTNNLTSACGVLNSILPSHCTGSNPASAGITSGAVIGWLIGRWLKFSRLCTLPLPACRERGRH